MSDKRHGWCRHCLEEGLLTFEHLPPRSARNKGWVKEKRGFFDSRPPSELGQWMEGHGRYALCDSCQHNPERWGYIVEYLRWREAAIDALRARVADGPIAQGALVDVALPYDFMPGRFSRFVLGMLLSGLDDPSIMRSHPNLGVAIRAGMKLGSPAPDGGPTEPWRLLVALADEDWTICTRPAPAPKGGTVISLVDAPFAFYLYLGDEAPRPDEGVDVSAWVTWGHDERLDGPRKRLREWAAPFRFGAWDFAELQYFLYLGLLNAVATDAVPDTATEELTRLERWGVVERSGSTWRLTELGSVELADAPLLSDRWRSSE
jgi:hypothetical protein